MSTDLKKACFQECISILESKLSSYKEDLKQLLEASEGEQKSSMGDKYETSTEMLAQEKRKINQQITLLTEQKQTLLNTVNKYIPSEKIKSGSLVKTDKGYFLIAISLGKIHINQTDVFVLSPISPLGKLLLNNSENDIIQLNNKTFNIQEIS